MVESKSPSAVTISPVTQTVLTALIAHWLDAGTRAVSSLLKVSPQEQLAQVPSSCSRAINFSTPYLC